MLSDELCIGGARWGELFTQPFWVATVTLCLGVALFAFNAFLVSTALPTAVREIGGVAVISGGRVSILRCRSLAARQLRC